MKATKTPRKYKRTCPKSANSIGKLGENLATNFFIDFFDCDVENLGEKVKAFDLLCTLGGAYPPYMFLVQVKTHYKGRYCAKTGNINTPVPKEKYKWLVDRPLPTYVAAVDYEAQTMYIAPAFDRGCEYPSIPTKYSFTMADKALSTKTAQLLLQDIKDYWEKIKISDHKQKFIGSIC